MGAARITVLIGGFYDKNSTSSAEGLWRRNEITIPPHGNNLGSNGASSYECQSENDQCPHNFPSVVSIDTNNPDVKIVGI